MFWNSEMRHNVERMVAHNAITWTPRLYLSIRIMKFWCPLRLSTLIRQICRTTDVQSNEVAFVHCTQRLLYRKWNAVLFSSRCFPYSQFSPRPSRTAEATQFHGLVNPLWRVLLKQRFRCWAFIFQQQWLFPSDDIGTRTWIPCHSASVRRCVHEDTYPIDSWNDREE